MTYSIDLHIERQQLQHAAIVSSERIRPAPGEVLLQIEKFALTANNITYAVFGEAMGYWAFFPAPAGQGRLPVWGFARMIESRCEGIRCGQRFYGFFPAGSHLCVQPVRISKAGFFDGAAHRAQLPAIYNRYLDCATDPMHQDGREALEALLRPLFTTSFLIAQSLLDQAGFGAEAAILTSASSKTAWGTAFALRELGVPLQRIGLTSARNRAFVEQLKIYDQVLDYDELTLRLRSGTTALDHLTTAVSIDFAGNGAVLGQIHARCGQRLKHSWLVGGSHRDARHSATNLAGVKPELFFAPSVAQHYLATWGGAQLQSRFAAAWSAFVAFAAPHIEMAERRGPQALRDGYLQVLGNEPGGASGLVIVMEQAAVLSKSV